MKANEAPEKIYVSNYNSGLTYNWHNERLAVNDIEYICVDVFIERAKKWFEERTEWINIDGTRHCDMESFEDFKKYIKEE